MTELGTGLGMLGMGSLSEAIERRPETMVSLSPETWSLLEGTYDSGGFQQDFTRAWANGQAFLHARDGLRGRPPVIIEWKGSQRAPGDEVAPIDLRIDHVYLVSCKYLSHITINASPFSLFDRLLRGAQGSRSDDWFVTVAGEEYQALYQAVRHYLGNLDLPTSVTELRADDRRALSSALSGPWPRGVMAQVQALAQAVSEASAERWKTRLSTNRDAEALLWRVLRIGSAPYFVLGDSVTGALRLRVGTPWDWRRAYRLKAFEVVPQSGGQPRVGWKAIVDERHSGTRITVQGHVEIRWSHGRFGGYPEAKVYLDTPHGDVPGYYRLR